MPVTASNLPLIPNLTEEEKLFFATVYGEAIGQGADAWMAIASVIMNRVGQYEWKKLMTVTQVIELPYAFDAYDTPNSMYVSAKAFLDNPNQSNCPLDLLELIQIVSIMQNSLMRILDVRAARVEFFEIHKEL